MTVIPIAHSAAPVPKQQVHFRRHAGYLIFSFCASLYLLPFIRLIQQRTDEGIFLSGAVRILHGQIFARDFVEIMGPGTFYWLAAFFKLFGVSFMASRVSLFITSLGTCMLLYYLSRRISRSYHSLPVILVIASYYGSVWPAISHHTDSNFAVLLAFTCLLLWYDKPRNSLLIATGALAGAATFIFQHKGILMLCAFLAWLWIQHRRKLASRSSLVYLGAGYLGVVGLVLAYFWSRGALGSLAYWNVLFPFLRYGPANAVPYAHGIIQDYWSHWVIAKSGFGWTVAMASILVVPLLFVAALPALVVILGISQGAKSLQPELLLYWLAGWALWLSEIQRMDIVHLAFGSPLLVILCIYLLGESRGKLALSSLQILAITGTCLAIFNLILVLKAQPVVTRVGSVAMFGEDRVLKALDDHVTAGEEIFIYPYCPTYYFLSSTTNPTRFSGAYNGNDIAPFREIVQVLEQHKVRHVLWDTTFEERILQSNFPGSTSMTPGRLVIEPYLESHYTSVAEEDGFRVMERKSEDHAR
jgi:hypothetical protein